MKIILFGASGMVGQGLLRECLLDPKVKSVLAIGRAPLGQKNEKLREIVHQDFSDFSAIENQIQGYDACFYSIGISSLGLTEADYTRVTYDFTLAAARSLASINRNMIFIYVSATGADSSEQGRSMWTRVRGKTENALLRLPFKAVYVFRPGFIQPLHGIKSKTKLYRVLYDVLSPLTPFLVTLFPKYATTTEKIGQAMIQLATHGSSKRYFENYDINHF